MRSRSADAPRRARASGAAGRSDRRRQATRAALVVAARTLLVHRSPAEVSIQEITDAADVGFGSFYNHFASKTELFQVATAEVIEEHGHLLDAVAALVDDPAEVLAVSLRTSGRLALRSPDSARVLLRSGLALLTSEPGLAPRVLRDLQVGMDRGRFAPGDPRTLLAVVGGGLLGVLHTHLDGPADQLEAAIDEFAELTLRMLGVPAHAAVEIAARPLGRDTERVRGA